MRSLRNSLHRRRSDPCAIFPQRVIVPRCALSGTSSANYPSEMPSPSSGLLRRADVERATDDIAASRGVVDFLALRRGVAGREGHRATVSENGLGTHDKDMLHDGYG